VSAQPEVATEPRLRFAWLWWAIGWLLVALVINDTLEPSLPKFVEVIPSDKLMHFGAYTVLSFWFAGLNDRRRYLVIGIGLIALGGVLEIGQGIMGLGRTPEWLDFLANSLGVCAGLGVAYAWLGTWMLRLERLFGWQK
jgi:hypothetical protein